MGLDDRNKVTWMDTHSTAADSGFRLGDTITEAEGAVNPKCPNLLDEILDSPSRTLKFKVDRAGIEKSLSLRISPYKTVGSVNYIRELVKLVFCGRKVNLIVLVTKLEFDPPETEPFKNSTREMIEHGTDQQLLNIFGDHENFNLVEREALTRLFEELKLQKSGAVSTESALKLGQMYGASHLFLIEVREYSNGKKERDPIRVWSKRLIEVKTARILSMDQDTMDSTGITPWGK